MLKLTPQPRVQLGHVRITGKVASTIVAGVFLVSGMLAAAFTTAQPEVATAATNTTLNFQARLQTAGGAIVPDGYYNVQFKIYDGGTAGGPAGPGAANAGTGSTHLWTESYYDSNGVTAGNDNRVRVKNGYLTVNLGSQTAFPAINWDQELWLTMNVGGITQTATPTYDGEMNPRLKLTGVPYAFRAGQLAKGSGGFTSVLELAAPTVGNQTFTVPDQGAAGSYTLLTTNTANANYIQNTTSPQTANFNVTGNGTVGGNLTISGNTTASGTINGLMFNKQYVHSGDANPHAYRIATLPVSSGGTYDHLRMLVTLNHNWNATSNSYLDVTFANRNGFSYQYSVRGPTPNVNATLEAYNNAGAIDIYLVFTGVNTFTNASYTILESQNVSVYAAPTDFGSTFAGSLVFDASLPSTYPPFQQNSVNGNTAFKVLTNSNTAFQVQNAGGSPVLNIDTTTSNFIANSDFEVDTTGWAAAGSTAVTRTTTAANRYAGTAGLQAVTTAAANDGVRVSTFTASPTFATSATWMLTFYARLSAGTFTTMQAGYDIGGGDVTCTISSATAVTAGFQRYSCPITLTTGQTISSIFIRQSDATVRTVYIDSVQLVTGANVTPYTPANVQINGVLTSPVTIQSGSNSTHAFQVQNSAGTGNTFVVDTQNNRAMINTGGYGTTLSVGGSQVNRTNSTNALQIQNNNQTPILGVNTVTPVANIISNPGFEQNTTNWAAKTGGAIARITTPATALFYGIAAGQVTTNTSAGGGVSYTQAMTLGTTYNLSFYARASTGTATGISFGYTNSGGDTDCQTGLSIPSTGFTRFSCSFTVAGTAGTAFYLKQSGTSSQIIYIDGFQLLASATSATPYSLGSVQLRGVIDTPVAFQANNNSTTAFQIQNTAGNSNLFVADTLNDRIGMGTNAPAYKLDVVGDVNTSTGFRVGGTLGATTTCTGGQLLQNAVVAGGIVTGGTCVAAGTGAVTTVGAFSGTSIANGASISGNTITFGPADGTNPGMVTTGAQTIAGAKSFSGLLTASAGIDVSGAASSINNNSNFATNIGTGTSNALVSIGGGSGTFALNTTNIDISSAGVLSGATGITMASGNFVQTGSGTFSTGTGNVSLNGATTVAGELYLQSNLKLTDRTRTFSSAYNTAIAALTPIQMGEMTFGGNSQNVILSGEIRGQSGGGIGVNRFSIAARADTLPAKSFTFIQEREGSLDITAKLYHDATTGRVVLGYQAATAPQNITWSVTSSERDLYNIYTNNSTYTVMNLTGLTEVLPGNSIARSMSGTLTVEGALTGLTGATISGGTANINATGSGATNIGTGGTGAVAIATGGTSGNVTIGGGSNTFTLNTSNIDISNTGAITGATGLTLASGNIVQTGTGSFSTGTGAVSLNGTVTLGSGVTLNATGNLTTTNDFIGRAATASGYLTTNTSSTFNGQYTKLAACTLTAQFQDCRTSATVVAYADGNGTTRRATVDWRVKQQNAMAGVPAIDLEIYNLNGQDTTDFTAVTIQNDATATVVELYGQIDTTFTAWAVSPTVNTSTKAVWLATQGFITPLPAGTQTASTYADERLATLTTTGNVTVGSTLQAATVNSTGNIQTGGTTRLDNAGVLSNITGFTSAGAFSVNNNNNTAVNIATGSSTALTTIGGGSGTFALNTTNIDISAAGAITGATGISMASGNFVQTGSGTFATGTGAVSLNGSTSVLGSLEVKDAAIATKAYRLRTTGGALDFEAGGTQLYLSNWSNADFTGTQRNYLVLESASHVASVLGSWQFKQSSGGTVRHIIDGTAGANIDFNQNGEATDFRVQGDTTSYLLYVQGSSDRVGINNANPGYQLDVAGDINSNTGFRVGGTAGATTTCSGGNFLQNAVVTGGIVTGGTCVAGGGSGVTTVGAFSGTSIANGASISGNTITFGPADGTNPGMVTTGAQTIAGAKTFNGQVIGNAGLDVDGGVITLVGNAASSISTTAGALTLNGFAGVNLQTNGTTVASLSSGGAFNVNGTTSINDNNNAVTNIGTGTTTSSVNIGGNANTVNIGVTGSTTTSNIYDRLSIGGNQTTTATNRVQLTGTMTSNVTTSQYGLQNNMSFTPNGASLSNLYGIMNDPSVNGSALAITKFAGMQSGISTTAGYTGKITSGYGLEIATPTLAGSQTIDNYRAISVSGGAINGNGVASTTVNNSGLYVAGFSGAATNATATVNNYGAYINNPTGSGSGTTNNYGLYMTSGSAAATNWGIYNGSASSNWFQGSLAIANVAIQNASAKLHVDGDLNLTTGSSFNINNATILDSDNLTFTDASNNSISSAAGQILEINGQNGLQLKHNAVTTASTDANGLNIATNKNLVMVAGTGTSTQTYNATGAGTASTINMTNTSGTNTNGLMINRNGASGTTTNGVNITNTAGTLTNGLTFSGTMTNMINSGSFIVTGAGAITGATGISMASGNFVQSGSGNFSTGTGTNSLNGSSIALGDASSDRLTFTAQILGGSPLVFQGSTDNSFATTLALTEPTANNTITLPNASGTVAVSATGNIALSAAGQISLTGQVGVANGGTGLGTITSNGVLYGNGTGNVGVTAAGTTGQCLISTTSAAPSWGTCGSGNASTLQDAYDGSGSTNPQILLSGANGGLKIRDNSTPVSGNLLQLQNSGGTATYFGVATTGMTIQNSSAVTLLSFTSSSSTLRIAKTGAAYIDLYHDGSNAYISQATGTLNLGSGTGNINLDVTAVGDTINASKTATLSGAYNANTFNVSEVLTGGANSITGSVMNISSTSTTSSTNTQNILRLNKQNGTGGNLILAQTGGSTTRFSVNDTGNLTATGGMSVNGGTINLNTTSANTVNIGNGAFANTIAIGNVTGATGVSINSGSGGIGIGNNGSSAGTITIGNGSGNLVNINAMGGGWQISTTGDATLEDIAMDGSFAQSGATTFATGTGAISLNGDTTVATGKLLILAATTGSDPTGTNGAMYYNSTMGKFRCKQAGAWFDCLGLSPEYNRTRPVYSTDFLDNGNSSAGGFWTASAISGGQLDSMLSGSGSANNPGIAGIDTNSGGSGAGYRIGGSNSVGIYGSETYEIIFQPRATNIIARMGFLDSGSAGGAPQDGAIVELSGTTLSGKTYNGGATSTTGSTYTTTTNTWYRARIAVNSGATSVSFTLYNMSGTQLWTNSLATNVPTGGTVSGVGMNAVSTNATNNLLMQLDYMSVWWDKDLAR